MWIADTDGLRIVLARVPADHLSARPAIDGVAEMTTASQRQLRMFAEGP
jgi:hypothetical protein